MKILSILNENVLKPNGGLGVHVRDMSKELCKDVDLIVVGIDCGLQSGGFFLVNDKEVKQVDLKDWKHTQGYFRLLNVFNTNEIVTRYGFINKLTHDDMFTENILTFLGKDSFDIVHLQDSTLWKVAKNCTALYQCKLIITCHLSFYLAHPKQPDNPYYIYDAQLEGNAFHKSNKVLTVSDSYKKELMDTYFLEEDRIVNIMNGVDNDFLKSVPYDKELRDSYDNKKPLVVFVGRLVPTKGVQFVLKAIREMPNHHFVLISSISPTVEDLNPLVKTLRKMQETYDNFEWINNNQEKKWEIMKVADVGVVPSLHEPFGIVGLEWLGLGVPLIVSNVGGLGEFCNDKNSVVINPNSDELINALKSFKRDESKVTEGLVTAESFNWKKVANKIKNVFDEVLKE